MTLMKTRLLTALLAAGFICATVHAQQPTQVLPQNPGQSQPGIGRRVPNQQNPKNPQEEPERRFDIRFDGGTVSELLKKIHETLGVKPNVIVAPSLRDTMVPDFDLHNVTLTDIFTGLNAIGA